MPVASKLASILNSIVDKNDLQAWTALIEFPKLPFLSVPTREGHRRSLASCINWRLGEKCENKRHRILHKHIISHNYNK